MFQRLGSIASRHPVRLILVWLVAAGGLIAFAPRLDEVVVSDVSAFLTLDAGSVRAAEALAETWPDDDLGNSAAVIAQREPRLRPADTAYLSSLEEWLNSPAAPDVVNATLSARSRPELARVLVSKDETTEILIVTFTSPPFEPPTNEAVDAIRSHIAQTSVSGLKIYVSGNSAVAADQAAAIDESIHRTTIATLVLVVLILLWVYRSPVTPIVPLITIGLAFVVSQGLVALLASAGMQVSSLVQQFMIVIVFGAGTDYCLFIVSRFREDVAASREYRRTMIGTVAIVGAVIASSAATVIVGFSAQGIARFGMFRTTGPAMAVSVVVTLAAGLTLTPALMRVFGRSLFWPAHPDAPPPPHAAEVTA